MDRERDKGEMGNQNYSKKFRFVETKISVDDFMVCAVFKNSIFIEQRLGR